MAADQNDGSNLDGRNTDGTFSVGNCFWQMRSSAGPKPKFDDPDDLWAACVEYFAWVHGNPLYEDRLVTFQGTATHVPVARMRAMSIGGLCVFLDIQETTWRRWRENRSDLSMVIEQAEAIIATQKFEGAAADLLNANIISRDLGLADRQEYSGRDGGPIRAEVSDRDVAKVLLGIVDRSGGAAAQGEKKGANLTP